MEQEQKDQRRMLLAIAHESLALVYAGRVRMNRETYYLTRNNGVHDIGPEQTPTQFVASGAGRCQVCACGLLMVAGTAMFNELPADANAPVVADEDAVYRYLEPLIGRRQRALIESAFMSWSTGSPGDGWWDNPLTEEEAERAFDFGRRFSYGQDEETLIAIMKNVIANDGEFAP
jgi:hypothetical protein